MRREMPRAHEMLSKAAGGYVDSGAWARQTLGHGAVAPKGSMSKPAKPTGTYPKHFFSKQNPGALANLASAHGIMPSMPPGLPPPPAAPRA